MKTETIPCYVCGNSESEFYDSENGYNLVKCTDCGLLYVNPRPIESEISEAIRTGLHRSETGEQTLKLGERRHPKKIAAYKKILVDLFGSQWAGKASGEWLDIGCGFGEFITAVQEVTDGKVRCTGVEPNDAKRAVGGELGLDIQDIDLSTHDKQYDFLSFNNVYSHLPNPVESLEDWKRFLRPGGELVLQTGDSADLPVDEIAKPHLLPDHLSFASKDIVCRILERTGYEVLEIRTYRLPSFPALTPVNLAKGVVRFFWPGKPSLFKNMFNPPMRPDSDMYVRARLK